VYFYWYGAGALGGAFGGRHLPIHPAAGAGRVISYTLGATAYGGRGRSERAVTQGGSAPRLGGLAVSKSMAQAQASYVAGSPVPLPLPMLLVPYKPLARLIFWTFETKPSAGCYATSYGRTACGRLRC